MATGKVDRTVRVSNAVGVYRTAWGTSLTFTLAVGKTALVVVNANQLIIVWNNEDGVAARGLSIPTYASGDPVKPIDGSTYSVSRNASDTKQVTFTRTGSATIEVFAPVAY